MNSFPITVFTEGVFDQNNKWLPKGTYNFLTKQRDNTVWGKIVDKNVFYKFDSLDFALMISLTNENKPEDDCPVCLEKINENKASLNDCVHVFHLNCIRKWLERKKTCPVCRKNARIKYKNSVRIKPRLLAIKTRNNLKNEYRKQFASRPNFLI